MKFLKYVLLYCILPLTLKADLKDELVKLQKSLRRLSTAFPKKETFIPKARPTDLTGIGSWLEQVIEKYKQNPLHFAQNIPLGDLNTINDMLVEYFTKAVAEVEDEEEDIEIDSEILHFVRIPLGEKRAGVAGTQYEILYVAIQRNNYPDVTKYSKSYISSLKKEDFSRPIQEAQQKTSALAAQIPDLPRKTLAERASMYFDMQQALKKMKRLMLPTTTGDAQKIIQEVGKLRSYFEREMQKAQQFLTRKYKAFQENAKIKEINTEYAEKFEDIKRTAKNLEEENTRLEALKIDTKEKKKQAMNILLYGQTPEEFGNIRQACSVVDSIVKATKDDKEKIVKQEDIKILCEYVGELVRLQEDINKISALPQMRVSGYTKAQAEATYNKIKDLQERLSGAFGQPDIPNELKTKLKGIQGSVLERLWTFKGEYEKQVRDNKENIGGLSKAMKITVGTVYAPVAKVSSICGMLEEIYTHKNETMPQDIKTLCREAREALRSARELFGLQEK